MPQGKGRSIPRCKTQIAVQAGVTRTADVQVIVGRRLRELAVVLSHEVSLVLKMLALNLPDPDAGHANYKYPVSNV